jgi:hypothetical protein
MAKFYKIYGYDRMMMEDYILPEKYKTQSEAKAACRVDEYVKEEKGKKMALDDKKFVMDTTMIEASVDQGIDLSDLKVVYQKKKGAWFVARISTGRGIARVLDSEF